ncbi:MAG: exo-alpha-sialidase [Acidobacteriales bacterium]|nr:exo-alpha-sialidase [Terriglobales bacterium]
MNRRGFVLATMGTGFCGSDPSERYPYATEALIAALEKPDLPRIAARTVVIHDPAPGAYQYSHHPHITYAFGAFLAMWSSGIEREDRPGQRILWSRSADGMAWSKPEILLECPEPPWRLTAGGWATANGRLYAFINRNRRPEAEALHAGLVWYPPLYLDVMEAGSDLHWTAPRTIDSDIVANESTRQTSAGTWLLAGYTARLESGVLRSCAGPAEEYVFHPAPRVLIPREELKSVRRTPPQRPLGEPSWYERRDKTLVCFFRDDHASFRLFASISADDGITWLRPRQTNIPDAKSKSAARMLSTGETILVSNPCVARKRNVLAVLVSRDGTKFDHGAILCDAGEHRYAYPSVIEREGRVWVVYSIDKRRIAVTDFTVAELDRTAQSRR